MNNSHFWFLLLNVSDQLAEIDPQAESFEEDVLAQLDFILDNHGRGFSPLHQFDCYAVVALCNTLRQLLARRRELLAEPS